METAPPKRTLAFPRWQERQLFHSFAWFTTSLLGGIVIAAIPEFVGKRKTIDVADIDSHEPLDRSRMYVAARPAVMTS